VQDEQDRLQEKQDRLQDGQDRLQDEQDRLQDEQDRLLASGADDILKYDTESTMYPVSAKETYTSASKKVT